MILFVAAFGGLIAYSQYGGISRRRIQSQIQTERERASRDILPSKFAVTPLWNNEYQGVLVQKLSEARKRIRVVMYQVSPRNDPVKEILDALIAANRRGVDVQVVLSRGAFGNVKLERDNELAVDYLTSHGVRARINRVPMETHAKLVVIDDKIVILGAHNWSVGALQINNELSLMIESDRPDPRPAAYFSHVSKHGGGAGPYRGSQTDTVVYLADYDYFALLKGEIERAGREIEVVLYLMRAEGGGYAAELIDRLASRARAGVRVTVILDDDARDADRRPVNQQAINVLRAKGIAARFDGTPKATHVKLVVIDGETVVVGSQNWTNSALGGGNFEFGVLVRSRKLAADVSEQVRELTARPRS